MNYGIYCNTPYQVLVAICFVLNYCTNQDICDLYGDIDNYIDMEECLLKIEKTDIFNCVYRVRRINETKNWTKANYLKLIRYLNPRRFFRDSVINGKIPPKKFYDAILISFLGPLARAFVFSNEKSEVHLFEDGLGSYLQSQHYAFATRKDKFFRIITGKGEDTINIKSMYLFCPEFYHGKQKIQKLCMPKQGTDAYKKLTNIFPSDDSSIYTKNKIVYLTQPIENNSKEIVHKSKIIEKKCEDILSQIALKGVVVRPHPRQKERDYTPWNVDEKNNSWELNCVNHLSDKSVLLARFSTAQFTPKLLYGIEPYLIFTYRLYPEKLDGVCYQELDDMVNRIRDIYSSPKKVIILNEINDLINEIMKIL